MTDIVPNHELAELQNFVTVRTPWRKTEHEDFLSEETVEAHDAYFWLKLL